MSAPEEKFEQGQAVTLLSCSGVIDRIVVEDLGAVILICRPEEYERASTEGRDPVSVGFKKTYVIPQSKRAT